MEDFYYAGGLPALLGQLAKVPGALHLDRITVTGHPFGEKITEAPFTTRTSSARPIPRWPQRAG